MSKRDTIVIVIIIILIAVLAMYFSAQKIVPTEPPQPPAPVVNALPAQAGLPAAVEAKRQAIYAAALTKNYATLASAADPELKYSFGGEIEGGFAEHLKITDEREEKSVFEIIPTLLKLPYAMNANEIVGDIYTWPSVFSIEASKWTAEDIAMMRTFLTDAQIESYKQFGGYVYYRIGINEAGKWIFYVAGD